MGAAAGLADPMAGLLRKRFETYPPVVHQIEELPEAQEEDGILWNGMVGQTDGCHQRYQVQPTSQREIWAQAALLASGTCAPSGSPSHRQQSATCHV